MDTLGSRSQSRGAGLPNLISQRPRSLKRFHFAYGLLFVSSLIFGKIGFLKYDLCFAQYLADAGLYESQEEAVSREEVLGSLDQVISNFMLFDLFHSLLFIPLWILILLEILTDCEGLG